MQSKTFTVILDNSLPLDSTLLTLRLAGTLTHEDLDVSVSNCEILNSLPIGNTPEDLELVRFLSYTIIIRVSHPTSTDIDDIELTFVSATPYTRESTAPMENNYKPLHNFYDGDGNLNNDLNYNSPFTTEELNLNYDSIIDGKLQFSYDQSVNIIFSDDINPVRLVNSRWILSEGGDYATLADRRQSKDTNTYSNEAFNRTELIPSYKGIPKVEFNGVIEGGDLYGGGYRYYFRYVTADGGETDICEESRLVEVHEGDTPTKSFGAKSDESTGKLVQFTLTELDDSFYGIKVYYSIAQGEFSGVSTAYKITSPFVIQEGTCSIIHTGYETVEGVNKDELTVRYSDIKNAKTLDTANNRLLVANIDLDDTYRVENAVRAASCTISEANFDITYPAAIDGNGNDNYSDPLFTYNKLGYWRGETYELGVVLVSGSGQSVVYPLHGIDNFNGDAAYNLDLLGNTNTGFYDEGENSLGVYRTNNSLDDLWVKDGEDIVFKGTNLRVKINSLIEDLETANYDGFFFVRRLRKKDKLMQGLLVPTLTAPTLTSYTPETVCSVPGNWLGIGVKSKEYGDTVTVVPAPNCLMPFGTESFYWTAEVDEVKKSGSVDFVLKAPILDYSDIKRWAFYSPDTDCNTVGTATNNNSTKKGISVSPNIISTKYIFDYSENSITKYQPTYLQLNGDFSNDKDYIWRLEAETQYVESGSFSAASRGFSGKLDRNLYIWQEQLFGKEIIDYTYYIDQEAAISSENIFNDPGAVSPISFTAVSNGSPSDIEHTADYPKVDSYMKEGQSPGIGVNYGRYIGIKIPTYETGLQQLNMSPTYAEGESQWPLTNRNYQTSAKGAFNDAENKFSDDPTYSYGHLAYIYEGTNALPLAGASWEGRYLGDEVSSYTAISERYKVEDFADEVGDVFIDVFGGDCYLGMQWKQVWSPVGLPEAPSVTDIDLYREDRTALGMLGYGFAIPIPVQSNYNFHLRTLERRSEQEYAAFGRDRSFLPLKEDIRGDRLLETSTYNFGYSPNVGSPSKYYRLNSNSPYIRLTYPNRVYASNPGVENEFWNGFTIFQGLNFKDYNSDLGYITKVITVNNFTYLIFHHGIAQVGVNERTMLSTDTGGVFTDSAAVLSQKSNVISDKIGSQHLRSVVGSAAYLYGVDAINKKVWRTNQKGAVVISDFKVQKILTSIIDEMESAATSEIGVFDIYSSYDTIKNEVLFTFHVRDAAGLPFKSRTLSFNESLGIWICETDDTRNFFFNSFEDRYSFNTLTSTDTIYKYYRDETNPRNSFYNKFYGGIYDTNVGYNVLDNPSVAKIFDNIYIVGNNSTPMVVTYQIENVNTKKDQSLVPYTNVAYALNGITVSGAQFDTFLSVAPGAITKWNGEPLESGDFISLYDAGIPYYLVCMGHDAIAGIIYIDIALPINIATTPLYLGYKNPIRTATSAYEDTYTKIVCRTLVKGGSEIYTPRGKWARMTLNYRGMSPMYIDQVITSYTTSYS